MGILENIRGKIGSKVTEIKEQRESDKREFKEHYDREFNKAHRQELKASAEKKAREDAYARVHPLESMKQRLDGLTSRASLEQRTGHPSRPKKERRIQGTSNSLGRSLEPLGDVGRSIGRQFEEMETPSWMRDFKDPKKFKRHPY